MFLKISSTESLDCWFPETILIFFQCLFFRVSCLISQVKYHFCLRTLIIIIFFLLHGFSLFPGFHFLQFLFRVYNPSLTVRPDTIKLLEENRILSDINCSNIFFDLSSRIMEKKTKVNKWDLLKLKIFCTTKEIINKT